MIVVFLHANHFVGFWVYVNNIIIKTSDYDIHCFKADSGVVYFSLSTTAYIKKS